MLGLVLIPGLLAAGIGSLIFLGLDSLTGLGTFSLAIPGPAARSPAQPGRVRLGGGDRRRWPRWSAPAKWRLGLVLRPRRRSGTCSCRPGRGLVVAGLAIAYAGDGQADLRRAVLGPVGARPAGHARGQLHGGGALLLVACKGLAYGVSLGSFRGGPVFPAMFIGAAGGIALSHLPGLPLVPGVAMGIGAMCAVCSRCR